MAGGTRDPASTDLGDLFDQAIAEVFAVGHSSTRDFAKSAGTKTDRIIDEIAAALNDLFGGTNTGRLSETFDEEIYAKAKPLFERLVNHALQQEAEQLAEHQRRVICGRSRR